MRIDCVSPIRPLRGIYKKLSSLPRRKARAKDTQHHKILGSRIKESPIPPVATSWSPDDPGVANAWDSSAGERGAFGGEPSRGA